MEEVVKREQNMQEKNINSPVSCPITSDNFDSEYDNAPKLLGGDRLLRPFNCRSIIRNTSTGGVYKVLDNINSKPDIKILDESELFSDKERMAGSISKINKDEYEIVSFDEENNIEINRLNKRNTIEFMTKHKLIF